MRRHSDSNDGRRTGRGRRARDRLLKGDEPQLATTSTELSNLLHFVGDDLRESALAVGGIESFLVRVESLLAASDLNASAVAGLGRYADIAERVERLGDTMDSLCRSLYRLQQALPNQSDSCSKANTDVRGEEKVLTSAVI